MTKEKRLGRGLEALLGRVPGPPEQAAQAPDPYGGVPDEPYPTPAAMPEQPVAETPAADGSLQIGVDQIDSNPFQPRQAFDESDMSSLSESLSAHGLLQPVVVRRVDDRYQLIAGERRLRAAVQAGWTDVPARLIEADDRDPAELAIVDNLQRKERTPIEKSTSCTRYIEQYGCKQEELAGRLKLDRSTIANLIRLLELPQPIQEAVRNRKITQGHARALLTLGEEQEQLDFCQRIQRERLSVRQTETAVQEAVVATDDPVLGVVDRQGQSHRPAGVQSDHLIALQEELRLALGTKVKITQNARGRGKLVIHFRNHQEFERLRGQLSDPGRTVPRAIAHTG